MMVKDEKKRLLDVRAGMKRKRPGFVRQDGHKKAKLDSNWRNPRGLHNKVRLEKRGYRPVVKTGYRSPLDVRHLDRDGLEPVRVSTVEQVKQLDPKKHSIILSGTLGGKKKIAIIKAAEGFSIRNASQETAKSLEENFKQRHSERQAKEKAREAEQKKLEKEAAKKEAEPEEPSEESSEQEKTSDGKETTEPEEKKTAAKPDKKPAPEEKAASKKAQSKK